MIIIGDKLWRLDLGLVQCVEAFFLLEKAVTVATDLVLTSAVINRTKIKRNVNSVAEVGRFTAVVVVNMSLLQFHKHKNLLYLWECRNYHQIDVRSTQTREMIYLRVFVRNKDIQGKLTKNYFYMSQVKFLHFLYGG